MDKRGKITVSVLIASILLISFSLYFVLAIPGENIKTYDENTKTITILDKSNNKIADITLNTPEVNYVMRGKDRLVAEYTINSYGDYSSVFNKLDFYDIKNNMGKFDRDFNYKYKTFYNIEVNDYETVCKEREINAGNGTTYIEKHDCYENQIGSHTEQRFQWNNFDENNLLPQGKITIGIFTDVLPNERVEWIPTLFDVEINEWAEWTEGMSEGLTHYYPFDETSGTNGEDIRGGLIGNQYNFTLTGGATFIGSGMSGYMLDCDGINSQALTSGGTVGFPSGSNNFTVNWWQNEDTDEAYGGVFGMSLDGSNNMEWFSRSGGLLSAYIGGTALNSYCSGTECQNGNWVQYAVIRNSTNILIYRNGILNLTASTLSNNVNNIALCYFNANGYYDGKIDELGLWNRTLSASEISDLYNGGTGIFYRFASQNVPPTIPVLLSPANGTGYAMNSTITFVWDNSTDADGDNIIYDLEIYNESDMLEEHLINSSANITEGTENTSINIKLSDYTTVDDDYYWRIRAYDLKNYSNWSDNRTFQYANWTITFNLTDSFTGEQIELSGSSKIYLDMVCDNGLNVIDSVNNPYTSTDIFSAGDHSCNATITNYHQKSIEFNADKDKNLIVQMSASGGLTSEEHTWLEELYDCVINGNCVAYDLWENTWKRITKTDRAVVTQEDFISNTLNSTSNITLNYTIEIPYKEGYDNGEYLPLRLFFWFTNADKTQCYNQDKRTDSNRAEDPYCFPLVSETLGPNNGSLTFTVNLRPSLSDGTYNTTRAIEIDPIVDGEVTWTNYGTEDIGIIEVEEENNDVPQIGIDKTNERLPSKSWITGAIIGTAQTLLSGWQIVSVIAIIGGVLVVFIISRTMLKLKENNSIKKVINVFLFSFIIIFFLNFASASDVGLIRNSTWSGNLTASQYFNTIAFGDIDNDNNLDMIQFGCSEESLLSCSTADETRIYINNGTSLVENLTWESNLPTVGESSVAFGDIDNDGDLDLILAGGEIYPTVYTNNGTTFVENSTWHNEIQTHQSSTESVNLGDIDNDGDLDLIIVDIGQTKNSTFLNNGTTFVVDTIWGQETRFDYRVSNALVDFDNDFDLDSISVGYDYSSIYINNGTTLDLSSVWGTVSMDHASLAIGDVDNDGDMDIFLMGEKGACVTTGRWFYENNGSSLATNSTWENNIAGLFYGSASFGDYDNNGYLDLALIGQCAGTPYFRIHDNNGTEYTREGITEDNLTSIQSDSVVWVDLDNDNDLDLVSGPNVYINNITTPNTAPTAPTNFSYSYNNREIKIGWNNGSDSETPSLGLYYNLKLGTASNNHSIISGIYGGQGDVSGGGGIAFGYFGNMMQRKNLTLKVDRLQPSTTYYWSVQTIDTGLEAGNWSSVQSFTTPADMNKPNITLNSPVDYFNSSSYTLTFNASVFDDLNLTNVSLWGSWEGGWHLNETNSSGINNTEYIFTKDLTNDGDGTYTWMIRAEDNATNTQNSSIRTFTIDTTAPEINITTPINNTNLTSNTLDVNYIYTETNPDTCWWTNNSGLTNISLASCGTNITTQVWDEGTNQVIIYINDSVNNINLTSVNFSVDSINPSLSIVYPINNTNYSSNTLDVNYTASDSNLDSCWYSNDSMSVNTTLASCGINITTVTWSEGQHNVIIWANDSFGNINSSSISFTIDTNYPIINLISPVNASTWSSSSTVTFSYNVTDIDIANCSLIIDDSIDQTETSITENTTQTFTKTLNNGAYYWNINCTDYVGYTNTSAIRNLSVSYTAPVTPPGGGGSSGGTAITTFWSNTYVVTDENFEKGFEKELSNKQRVKVSVSGESHYVGIVSLTQVSATINISSNPITVTLAVGEDVKVDILNDGWYDIYVKLNEIVESKANITIKSIHEEIPEGEGSVETSGEGIGDEVNEEEVVGEEISEKSMNYWIYLVIGLIVVGLILVGIKFLRRYKGYRRWKKHTLVG